MLSQLLTLSDASSIREIHRIACWAMAASVIVVMTETGNSLSYGFINGRPCANISGTLWIFPMALNTFNVTFPAFYVIMLRLLVNHEVRCLNVLSAHVNKGVTSAEQVMTQADKLMRLKEEFEHLLNHIPAILFVVPFITIPEMIVAITGDIVSHRLHYAYTDMLYYLFIDGIHLTVLLLFVISVTRDQRRARLASKQLIRCIQAKYARSLAGTGYQSVIEELRLDQSFTLTGYSLFVIEWPILLSTVSAVVSIGVLVIQVSNLSSQ